MPIGYNTQFSLYGNMRKAHNTLRTIFLYRLKLKYKYINNLLVFTTPTTLYIYSTWIFLFFKSS